MGFGTITLGVQTMIIGGSDFSGLPSMPTETWAFYGVSKIIQPNFPNDKYAYGIALLEVDANFCKKGKSLRF